MSKLKIKCRICANDHSNSLYSLTERHFGMGHTFDYIKCSSCGSLQISNYPENIADYYPADYNAFDNPTLKQRSALLSYVNKLKTLHTLNSKPNIIGWLMNKFMGPGFTDRLSRAHVSIDDSILDVGTGSGHRLHWLQEKGFTDLTGTDIFIDDDISYPNGIRIFKKDITDINRKYDLVMLNHAFEHMPDPLKVLHELKRIVKPGGFILIRIPVFSEYMWQTYGDYWIGLEPPRHFYIHTESSMYILSEKAGLKLNEVLFESSEYQIIGSEQFKMGITRRAKNSYFENPGSSAFSKDEIKAFKRLASDLDMQNDGFSACFYLKKPE